jgi:hypothetical protein
MCASNSADRSTAVTALANAMETYRPTDENDSAAGAVESALVDHEDKDCLKR